jgi:hypothetical protein
MTLAEAAMSPAEALRAAHTAGITVTLDHDGILLEAAAAPPKGLLDALVRHKFAIVALLKQLGRADLNPTIN